MKTYFALITLLFSITSFACGNIAGKPSYLSAQSASCFLGNLADIKEPRITIGNGTYKIGFQLEHLLWDDSRENALCRAFGFKSKAQVFDNVFAKDKVVMTLAKHSQNGPWLPNLAQFDNRMSVITKLRCYTK